MAAIFLSDIQMLATNGFVIIRYLCKVTAKTMYAAKACKMEAMAVK